MTGSIRNFEKLNFTPKSSVFCFSQGQTSEYDRLAQKPEYIRRPDHMVARSLETERERADRSATQIVGSKKVDDAAHAVPS